MIAKKNEEIEMETVDELDELVSETISNFVGKLSQLDREKYDRKLIAGITMVISSDDSIKTVSVPFCSSLTDLASVTMLTERTVKRVLEDGMSGGVTKITEREPDLSIKDDEGL